MILFLFSDMHVATIHAAKSCISKIRSVKYTLENVQSPAACISGRMEKQETENLNGHGNGHGNGRRKRKYPSNYHII